MRSLRSLLSVLLMFGAGLFATLSPTRAFAEWETVGSTTAYCVTNVANSGFYASSLKVSPIMNSGSVNSLVSSTYGYIKAISSPSGLTSTTVIYVMVPVSGGNIPSGKKFRINADGLNPLFHVEGSSTSAIYLSPENLRYWVRTGSGSYMNMTVGADGLFTASVAVTHVFVSFTASRTSAVNGATSCALDGVEVLVQVPDGEPTVEGYIQNQTNELKSTDGSSGIVSGMQGQGQQIANNLNFVQQTASFVTGTFDAIAGESASQGITFPGLTIMGHQIIASQDVPFLGYLGEDLENTIRTFFTMVIFLAWVMGLRGFYRKIFLGETDVEVVNEE